MRPYLSLITCLLCACCLISCSNSRNTLGLDAEQRQISDRSSADGPRILCVVAHPDDEAAFAGTLYKSNAMLNGISDLLIITNGEGGFKYASLGESIYGLELTDEKIGRRELPKIRANESANGVAVVGMRNLYLLGQKDHRYTRDPNEILQADPAIWDLDKVRRNISTLLHTHNYDFIFVHMPVAQTHAHHKCASLLTLEVVQKMPAAIRPCILGSRSRNADSTVATFTQLEGFPISKIIPDIEFEFNRMQKFGYKNKLNYKIIVNWLIAEHKSQGTMQLGMNGNDLEVYSPFAVNTTQAIAAAKKFFTQLEAPQFAAKTYGYGGGVPK